MSDSLWTQTEMPPPSPPSPPKRLAIGAPQPPSWFKRSAQLGLSAGGILLFFMFVFSFVVSILSAGLVAGTFTFVVRALVFYKAFEWFLSPYANAPVPSFAVCLAMSFILSILWRPTENKPKPKQDEDPEAKKQNVFANLYTILGVYINLLVTLGFMWLIHIYQNDVNEWFTYFSNWIVG